MRLRSKKTLFYTILPLLVFNLILVANILIKKEGQTAANLQCYNDTKVNNYPFSLVYPEEIKCKNCQRVNAGKTLFELYGEASNCWLKENNEEKQKCYQKYPYGGLGSFYVGDNLVISEGSAITFAGEDGSGLHWLMSSTSEPVGNVLGLNKKSSDLLIGNDLIINKNAEMKGVEFAAGAHKVDSKLEQKNVGGILSNINSAKFNNNLEILEKGVCGWGKEGNACLECNTGSNYTMLTPNGLEIKGILEVDGDIRLKANAKDCEKGDCGEFYRIANPFADKINNFINKYDNKNEEFIAFPCDGCNVAYCHPENNIKRQKLISYSTSAAGSYGEIRTCNLDTSCDDCGKDLCGSYTSIDKLGKCN